MGSMSLTIYLVRNMVTPIERPILMTICSPGPALSAHRALAPSTAPSAARAHARARAALPACCGERARRSYLP